MSSCYFGDSYNKSCHKCDKREGDRCYGDVLGKCWVAYLLAVWQVTATIEDGKTVKSDPGDYDEIVTSKEAETIDAFSSQVIHAKMKTAHQGGGINVMTQSLFVEDGSLPHGLMVQNAYMEVCSGSKITAVVLRTSTACPKMLRKKMPVAGQPWLLRYQISQCRSV